MTNDFWGFQSNLLVKMLGHKLDELKLQLECQTTGPQLVRSLISKGSSAKKQILSFSLKKYHMQKFMSTKNIWPLQPKKYTKNILLICKK